MKNNGTNKGNGQGKQQNTANTGRGWGWGILNPFNYLNFNFGDFFQNLFNLRRAGVPVPALTAAPVVAEQQVQKEAAPKEVGTSEEEVIALRKQLLEAQTQLEEVKKAADVVKSAAQVEKERVAAEAARQLEEAEVAKAQVAKQLEAEIAQHEADKAEFVATLKLLEQNQQEIAAEKKRIEQQLEQEIAAEAQKQQVDQQRYKADLQRMEEITIEKQRIALQQQSLAEEQKKVEQLREELQAREESLIQKGAAPKSLSGLEALRRAVPIDPVHGNSFPDTEPFKVQKDWVEHLETVEESPLLAPLNSVEQDASPLDMDLKVLADTQGIQKVKIVAHHVDSTTNTATCSRREFEQDEQGQIKDVRGTEIIIGKQEDGTEMVYRFKAHQQAVMALEAVEQRPFSNFAEGLKSEDQAYVLSVKGKDGSSLYTTKKVSSPD